VSARSYLLGRRAGWRAAASANLTLGHRLQSQGDGWYRSQRLDGHVLGCVWDRLRCRLHLEAGASFVMTTHSSDVDRGDAGVAALPDDEWSAPVAVSGPFEGKWDALITSPPGRYLWLRLYVVGNAQASAIVDWISLDYPRNTSLRLLPAIFSTSEGGRDLNERFMAFFDAMRDGVLEEIRDLASVIDPRTTDAEAKHDFLTWLGAWFDIELFRSWPVHRRREVVAHAGELFRLRGTPQGIKLFIELATGRKVTILEHYQQRTWWFTSAGLLGCSALFGSPLVSRIRLDGTSRIGETTINSVPSPYLDPFSSMANSFCVLVPSHGASDDAELSTIRLIIEAEKPAHTTFEVYAFGAEMRLGMSSQLGLDSVFGHLAPPSILPGHERAPRLGVTATL